VTNVLTPAQVANRWQVSERHVRNMVARGELPGVRLGGKLLRIRLADVEAIECPTGDLPDSGENIASPGMMQKASGAVIDLEQATRKRRPASPRLDTPSLRGRAARR
jgi:excisionase family DNA binding protein